MSEDKRNDCHRAGAAVLELIEKDIKPSEIMTRKAFENAITVVIALGGSTNAVLHLLAMAFAANVELELDDFTRIGARVPLLADLRPSGKYLMSELISIGGIRPIMKMLLDAGLLHGDCMTVTGKTMAENLSILFLMLMRMQQPVLFLVITKVLVMPLLNQYWLNGLFLSITINLSIGPILAVRALGRS